MASSTEEHTVESRNETQVRTVPHKPATKSALEHFQEYGRDARKSWPSGASALGSS